MKSTKTGLRILVLFFTLLFAAACGQDGPGKEPSTFQLQKVLADGITLSSSQTTKNIPVNGRIKLTFSAATDTSSVKKSIFIYKEEPETKQLATYRFDENDKVVIITPKIPLEEHTLYKLAVSDELKSAEGLKFLGTQYLFQTKKGRVQLLSSTLNGREFLPSSQLREVAYDDVSIQLQFSEALDVQGYESYISLSPKLSGNISISPDSTTITIQNKEPLDYYRFYSLYVSENLTAANGYEFTGFQADFQTGLNPEYKFPEISDEQLLTKIQEQTFRYFWDFAHPVSGLARERNTSGDIVTIGGSGFGLMAIIVGIERGFISRNAGIERFKKTINFLAQAERFHGVWPHWLNGATGDAVAFSTFDDGGDLVETSFMAQGLLTVRQYLNENNSTENELIIQINELLETIEWDWYTKGDQKVLYWHWSPEHEWKMNMKIQGYNEALITYVLAASSATHGIDAEVYHKGWAREGDIQNGKYFYGINLPLGFDYGGPLFFAHYSFSGLDPRNLTDRYANYWQQNKNHTLINRAHGIENPNNYVGYSSTSWGFSASDDPDGYLAHSPTRDNGTITPTAAISSITYTPAESMEAIRHFYYVLGDKLWGEYGFYDAFNPGRGWWANSYLAIDQGPIVIMIENYRTALLWDLFMSAPEVQQGLEKLDFTYH